MHNPGSELSQTLSMASADPAHAGEPLCLLWPNGTLAPQPKPFPLGSVEWGPSCLHPPCPSSKPDPEPGSELLSSDTTPHSCPLRPSSLLMPTPPFEVSPGGTSLVSPPHSSDLLCRPGGCPAGFPGHPRLTYPPWAGPSALPSTSLNWKCPEDSLGFGSGQCLEHRV